MFMKLSPGAKSVAIKSSWGVYGFLKKNVLFFCLSLLLSSAVYADISSESYSQSQMNPYELFTKNADQLKFPPSAGVGVYWGNGRFNIALNNLYDEESKKCIFQHIKCFRQEGDFVYATGKGGWMVLNLIEGNFKNSLSLADFNQQEQAILRKLLMGEKGNVNFNPNTLMPNL